jgi:hypothetical protein
MCTRAGSTAHNGQQQDGSIAQQELQLHHGPALLIGSAACVGVPRENHGGVHMWGRGVGVGWGQKQPTGQGPSFIHSKPLC